MEERDWPEDYELDFARAREMVFADGLALVRPHCSTAWAKGTDPYRPPWSSGSFSLQSDLDLDYLSFDVLESRVLNQGHAHKE